MKSQQGQLVVSYTKTGLPRYSLEIHHKGLHKYQVVRADDPYVVQQKAHNAMSKWDQMWNRRQEKEAKANSIQEKKEQASQRTREAEEAFAHKVKGFLEAKEHTSSMVGNAIILQLRP